MRFNAIMRNYVRIYDIMHIAQFAPIPLLRVSWSFGESVPTLPKRHSLSLAPVFMTAPTHTSDHMPQTTVTTPPPQITVHGQNCTQVKISAA